ncbi:MAG: RCC1 domain-containing protein, partial [Bradymonadaceae bacterium]
MSFRNSHHAALGLLVGALLMPACAFYNAFQEAPQGDAGEDVGVAPDADIALSEERPCNPADAGFCDGEGCAKPVSIHAGADHACVLLDDGRVACWGEGKERCPALVPIENVRLLSTGWNHTCAVNAESVSCWATDSEVMIVDGLDVRAEDITSISAGAHHSCILHDEGRITCWGAGPGEGVFTLSDRTGIKEISAGWNMTCLVSADDEASCLGDTDPDGDAASVPLAGAQNVVAGLYVACAIEKQNNQLRCWGRFNPYWHGKEKPPSYLNPVRVWDQPEVALVATGPAPGHNEDSDPDDSPGLHICALSGGIAHCWGDNSHGQLGRPGPEFESSPVAVQQSPSNLEDIAVGDSFTCALDTASAIWCWGSNKHLILGTGDTEFHSP